MEELLLVGRRRKALGLTQSQLAAATGVSQSFIAKVEQGSLDPAYSKIKRVFEVLDKMEHRERKTIESVMNRKIVSVSAADPVRKVIEIMRKKGISQLPVLKDGAVVGSVSERTLLLLEEEEGVRDKPVVEIMDDAFPTVPAETPLKIVGELLAHGNPAVMVVKGGKPVGIVSKADILKAVR